MTEGNFSKKGIKQPFSWEPNSIINNPNISMKAKGLWLYMNSKPEGWNFAANRIAEDCCDGPDSIRAGLRELIENGLLSAKKRPDGTILYILCSKTEAEPVEKPEVFHNPNRENPNLGSEPNREKSNLAKSQFGKIPTINNKEIEVRKNNKKEGAAGLAGEWPAGTLPRRENFNSEKEWLEARYKAQTITI